MVLSFLFFITHLFFQHHFAQAAVQVATLYGSTSVEEPVLIELLECPSMQRLKNIQQYGVTYYIKDIPPYNRYDHSIGVFYFVRTYGGSLHEQIAALLHDVSHTVFSHVGDHLFKHYSEQSSYQDDVHLWFIGQTEIADILNKYGISLSMIDHKSGRFSLLERDIPQLCADRLEYVLYGGFIENKLTRGDIAGIVDCLAAEDNIFVFKDRQAARLFAQTALYLSEHTFGSAFNYFTNHLAGKILRRALKINEVTLNEILHSTDRIVWDRLCQSADEKIKNYMNKLCNCEDYYKQSDSTSFNLYAKSKFRGIDPYIKTVNGLVQLSEIDQEFSTLFQSCKQRMADGLYILTK